MPTKHVVTTYTFDELGGKAKEAARDWYRRITNQSFAAEDFKEEHLTEPAAYYHRVKTEECHFSLSYCQGDGVAFYGAFDLDYFMADPGPEGAPPDGGPLAADRSRIQALIRQLHRAGYRIDYHIAGADGRYHHWNTMRLAGEVHEEPRSGRTRRATEALVTTVEQLLNEYLTAVSRDIAERGYAQLEYEDSAEAVDENIEANEYEFTADGRRFVVPPEKPR